MKALLVYQLLPNSKSGEPYIITKENMATKQTITNISYRKSNRNYSDSISWTEDMNNDVYNFYVEARKDPSRGYMKRLKTLWDESYPEFRHLTENHLRQKATHVEKKKKESDQEVGIQEEVSENPTDPVETIITEAETENVNNEESSSQVNDKTLYEELELKFVAFYNNFIDIPVKDRNYSTRINNIPQKEVMEEMNKVISTFIEQKHELTFWDINVIHYAATITICDKQGKLKHNDKKSS